MARRPCKEKTMMQIIRTTTKILSRVMEDVPRRTDQSPKSVSPTTIGLDQKPQEKNDATLMKDKIPVIVASMRGGHRCLAADRSKCAYIKYLSGQDGSVPIPEDSPLPVPSVGSIKYTVGESTDKGEDSSGRTCTNCHTTFSTSSNRNRHIRRMHCHKQNTVQEVGPRPMKKPTKRILCGGCGKDYKLWRYFSRHLKLFRCKDVYLDNKDDQGTGSDL